MTDLDKKHVQEMMFTDGNSDSTPRQEKISETDRLAIELAKSRKETAMAEAKTSLANHEKAEILYKYTVLQVYMKNNLSANDALQEDGTILYGGAKQS